MGLLLGLAGMVGLGVAMGYLLYSRAVARTGEGAHSRLRSRDEDAVFVRPSKTAASSFSAPRCRCTRA